MFRVVHVCKPVRATDDQNREPSYVIGAKKPRQMPEQDLSMNV
jgi:hypothetical protein